jgi:hypothetical protein
VQLGRSLNVDQVTVGNSYHPSEEYGIEMSVADTSDSGLLDEESCRSGDALNASSSGGQYGRVNILPPIKSLFNSKWSS